MQEARLGDFDALDGHFQYAPDPVNYLAPYRNVLNLLYSNIKGSAFLDDGFEADGEVALFQSTTGADLSGDSGHFINPARIAPDAADLSVAGNVILMSAESPANVMPRGGFVKFDGLARFVNARVRGLLTVDQAIFGGKRGEPHGLSASAVNVGSSLIWREVEMPSGAKLDLSDASIPYITDEERSWPSPGNLLIDGLTYSGFQVSEPHDAPADAQNDCDGSSFNRPATIRNPTASWPRSCARTATRRPRDRGADREGRRPL